MKHWCVKKLLFFCLFNAYLPGIQAVRYIFQEPATQAGDNLVSLCIAHVYAKKYNLTLAVVPFKNFELFQCYHLLPHMPPAIFNNKKNCVRVNKERDILTHLHNPDTHFYTHVLSDKSTITPADVSKAKKLLKLNKNIDIPDIPQKNTRACTIAIHIRKGNGGGEMLDGQLYSEQIFDYDRSCVHYTKDRTRNPFYYFESEERFCNGKQFPGICSPDIYWPTKFPPEQYYLDQINKIATAVDGDIVVRLCTDEKDPLAMLERLRQKITNPRIAIQYHDNREKGYQQRIVEDLALMTQCDVLVRSTSRFAIVAEIIGHFKTVFFPIKPTWLGKKLVMTTVGVRKY